MLRAQCKFVWLIFITVGAGGCAVTAPLATSSLPSELSVDDSNQDGDGTADPSPKSFNRSTGNAEKTDIDVRKLNRLLEDVQQAISNEHLPAGKAQRIDDFPNANAVEPTQQRSFLLGMPGRETSPVGPLDLAMADVFASNTENEEVGDNVTHGVASTPKDWTSTLSQSRQLLQREIVSTTDLQRKARLETRLQLLNVIGGNSTNDKDALESWDPQRKAYWQHLIMSMTVSLSDDDSSLPQDLAQRSSVALEHLREAERYLAGVSTLRLDGVRFCKRVEGYGSITPFPRSDFRTGQEVLLYVQVHNISSQKEGNAYATELAGSYEVFDGDGVRVASRELPLDKQEASFYRRDYFIAYRIYLPQKVPPGEYSLALTIEDRQGKHFGHATIPFRIKK